MESLQKMTQLHGESEFKATQLTEKPKLSSYNTKE